MALLCAFRSGKSAPERLLLRELGQCELSGCRALGDVQSSALGGHLAPVQLLDVGINHKTAHRALMRMTGPDGFFRLVSKATTEKNAEARRSTRVRVRVTDERLDLETSLAVRENCGKPTRRPRDDPPRCPDPRSRAVP
jgi:hypothetical protein